MKLHSNKKYLFEPGDLLSKIASEEFKVSTAYEAKERLKKKILESVGNTRYQLKAEVEIHPLNISSNGGNSQSMGKEDFASFDATVRVYPFPHKTGQNNLTITIPARIRDNQLLPIDTADFMGTTFLFSKKFFEAALLAAEEVSKNPYVLDQDSSFAGIEDAQGTFTDNGRIRDVLQIRNKEVGTNGWMANAPMFMTASEHLDAFLEKSANLTEFKDIKAEVEKKAFELADELVKHAFEKKATLTEDIGQRLMESASVFQMLKAMNWKKLADVADKACVEIVDLDVESESMKLKKAVVFKGLYAFGGRAYNLNETVYDFALEKHSGSVIIDEDYNYKVLRASSEMASRYLVADSKPDFKIKAESLEKVMGRYPSSRSDVFFLIIDGGLVGPVNLTCPFSENQVFFANDPANQEHNRIGKVAKQTVEIRSLDRTMVPKDRAEQCVFVLDSKTEGLKAISEEERSELIGNLFENYRDLSWTLENCHLIGAKTMVIAVKDFIRTPVESLNDVIFGYKNSDKPLLKAASEDSIVVEKPIPDVSKYNVVLIKGMLNRKIFNGLFKEDVLKLLKSVDVPEGDAISMVAYLDAGERKITKNIPLDFSMIDGSLVETKAADIVKNLAGSMFGKREQEEVLKEIVSSQVADLLAEAPGKVFDAASMLTRLASDAENLADRFEKLAIDNESEDFLTIAKCMVATSRMDKMMHKVATVNTMIDARDLFKELKAVKPLIEKSAALLYELRGDQETGGKLIGDNTIVQSFRTLGRLNEYASY